MSRTWDPETDQMPGGGGDTPADVERPSGEGSSDPIPVPPSEIPPAPVEEPLDSPNGPIEPNPDPIGDPASREPMEIV